MKKNQGGDRKSSGQNVHKLKTAESLAEKHGVSARTIKNDGRAEKENNLESIGLF